MAGAGQVQVQISPAIVYLPQNPEKTKRKIKIIIEIMEKRIS